MDLKRTFSTRVTSLILIAVAVGALSSCGKKEEDMTPVNPGETRAYKDNVLNFSFKAPKAWVVEPVPGKSTFAYSSAATETRFQKFTEGDYGARVGVGAIEGSTKEQAVDLFKQSMENVNYGNAETTTLGGLPAVKVTYSVADEDGLNGYRIFADKDSIVTYFDAATFGANRMKKFGQVFDLAEKSVQPAFKYKIKNGQLDSASLSAMMESMKPSETFATYEGSGYTIQYPDNFHANGIAKGVQIQGERPDAVVRVEALQAPQGVDLNAFVAENAAKAYRGAAVQSLSLSGKPAKMISYGAQGAVARAYFVMSGQTVYRITVSWPTSQEAAFRPALEKSVQSFKLK